MKQPDRKFSGGGEHHLRGRSVSPKGQNEQPLRVAASVRSTSAHSMATSSVSGCEIDLLEIFHARQMRDMIITHLKRLNQQNTDGSLHGRVRRNAIAGYYKAQLLTTAELLQDLGDDLSLR
ncbi:MAG: hypothetical protein AAF541_24045 [Pseudomonadota bacterium]